MTDPDLIIEIDPPIVVIDVSVQNVLVAPDQDALLVPLPATEPV